MKDLNKKCIRFKLRQPHNILSLLWQHIRIKHLIIVAHRTIWRLPYNVRLMLLYWRQSYTAMNVIDTLNNKYTFINVKVYLLHSYEWSNRWKPTKLSHLVLMVSLNGYLMWKPGRNYFNINSLLWKCSTSQTADIFNTIGSIFKIIVCNGATVVLK